MKKTNLLLLLSAGVLLASCGGSSFTSSSGVSSDSSSASESSVSSESTVSSVSSESTVSSVSSEPLPINIGGPTRVAVGQTAQLTASVEGVAWSVDDESLATVSATGLVTGISRGTVTVSASKEGYITEEYQLSVIDQITDQEELGIYGDSFFSKDGGFLSITPEGANYFPNFAETDEGELRLVPTELVNEVYKAQHGPITEKKTIPTLYFGAEFNDTAYRARLSTLGKYKSVILETYVEEEWKEVDSFMPAIYEFAGAFNGLEAWNVNSNNYVYLYSSNFDYESGGFPIDIYYARNLYATTTVNISFFSEIEEGVYLKGIDAFDLSDGMAYEMPVAAAPEGLVYFPESADEEPTLCWYPDFSPIVGQLYTDTGDSIAFYYEEETQTIFDRDEREFGDPEVLWGHDFGYTCVLTEVGDGLENPATLQTNLNADYWFVAYSSATEDESFAVAPVSTFYDTSFAYFDFESAFVFADNENTLEFGYQLDEDWNESLLVRYNGEALTDFAIVAGPNGRAYLTFTVGEGIEAVHYNFFRGSDTIGHMYSGLDFVGYFFDYNYYADLYVGEYFGAISSDVFSLTIDSTLTLSFHNELGDYSHAGTLVFDEEKLSVVLQYEKGYFTLGSADLHVYFDHSDEYGGITTIYVEKEAITPLFGTYYLNGQPRYEFNDYKWTIDGFEGYYEITILTDAYGEYRLGFSVYNSFGELVYFLTDFLGTFTVYETIAGSLKYQGVALLDKYWANAVGTYVYEGEDGTEYLILDNDGKLQLSTYNGEGALELKEYDYTFSVDPETGELLLIVLVGEGRSATFTRTTYGYSIGGNLYMEKTLAYVQGVYYSPSYDRVIEVRGDKVYVDGALAKDAVITPLSSGNGATIKYNDVTYTYCVDEFEGFVVTMENPEQDIYGVLERFDFNLADYVGEWKVGEDTYKLEANALGDYTMYKNGSFFMDNYSIVMKDHHVCVRYATPFGTVYLYLNGEQVQIIVE